MRDPGGQAALVHHPDKGGIWSRYLLTGGEAVNAAPWLDALARGQVVGTCRECGGYLKPAGQPHRVGLTDWYPTECIGRGDTGGCGHEPAAPGPRPKPKPNPHNPRKAQP